MFACLIIFWTWQKVNVQVQCVCVCVCVWARYSRMVYGPEVDQSDRTARQKNVTWWHRKWGGHCTARHDGSCSMDGSRRRRTRTRRRDKIWVTVHVHSHTHKTNTPSVLKRSWSLIAWFNKTLSLIKMGSIRCEVSNFNVCMHLQVSVLRVNTRVCLCVLLYCRGINTQLTFTH